MSDINVVHKTQRLLVDMPTRTVTFIMAGPPGPRGEQGPTGSGAGGFNFTQIETPYALEDGATWYKTDTGVAYVWYDNFWIQYAPGGGIENPYSPPASSPDAVVLKLAELEARLSALENP